MPPLEETVARIDAVTTEDVRDFAERLATAGDLALALYGPVERTPERATLAARLAA